MAAWLGRSVQVGKWPRGLRPLVYWDLGFESRRRHGCLSLFLVLCILGRCFFVDLIALPEESYQVWCILEGYLETSMMVRSRPTGAVEP